MAPLFSFILLQLLLIVAAHGSPHGNHPHKRPEHKRAVCDGVEFGAVLSPRPRSGPHHFDQALLRSNLPDDGQGQAIILEIALLDIATCSAMKDAHVEIWNAAGHHEKKANRRYSFRYQAPLDDDAESLDVSSSSRGVQVSDEEGKVTFNIMLTPEHASHLHMRIVSGNISSENNKSYDARFHLALAGSDDLEEVFSARPDEEQNSPRHERHNRGEHGRHPPHGRHGPPHHRVIEIKQVGDELVGSVVIGLDPTARRCHHRHHLRLSMASFHHVLGAIIFTIGAILLVRRYKKQKKAIVDGDMSEKGPIAI